jgi:amino acid transporter
MEKHLLAWTSQGLGDLGTVVMPGRQGNINSLSDIILVVIDWALGIAGAFAVVAIIYSGFMYITAGDNTQQAEKAKKNLVWAITGVVLVILSFVIVTWVGNIVNRAEA